MGAGGEARPDINGLANSTHVPGICVLSVTWGLWSSAACVATCVRPLIGVEDIVFERRFGVNV